MTQQLTGGSLDIALSVGITDPIRAIEKGAPLALIRIVGNAAPYVLIGKPGLKSIAELKGKTISTGADNDITTVYFERMMAANGIKKGDYTTLPAGVAAARFAALKAGVVDAAVVLPPVNFQAERQASSTLGFAADYVKDLPFTGMAVNRRWAARTYRRERACLLRPTRVSPGSPILEPRRSRRAPGQGRQLNKENAEASYDYLRRIEYFEPGSMISRKKLHNLLEVEQHAGTVPQASRSSA